MIKKVLGLLTVGLGFIGVSFGASYTQTFYLNTPAIVNDNIGSNEFTLKGKLNFDLNGYRIFQYTYYNDLFTYFWSTDGLYLIVSRSSYGLNDPYIQGYVKNFWLMSEYKVYNGGATNLDPSSFYASDTYSQPDELYFYDGGTFGRLCFNYDTIQKTICHQFDITTNSTNNITGSQNITFVPKNTSEYTSNGFSSYVKSSIFGGGGGGGDGGITVNYGSGAIIIGSDESAINYYEKTYGRDEKICYVGIDNYTDLYGTRVSFDEGSGLNIFQVFSGLYGNTDLNKVYVWLNTWLINYDEWFIRYQRNGLAPTYFATYNSGTNQVDLYYTGLDVSPFINKPVALYFMANNIYDHSPYKTMGSSVVSYCNLKINSGSFDQIIDQSDKNNIDNYSENSNQNIGLNPDGTVKDIIDYGYFSGDAFEFSGSDLSFSGGNSVKTSLIGFFDFVSNLFSYSGSSSSSSGNPIIPSYIIWGLILVILFKVFKRR